MRAEREQELPVRGVPELDVVVESGRCDELPIGREGDVVDLLLVAEQAGDRLCCDGRMPEVYSEIVASGNKALHDFTSDSSSCLEARAGFGNFLDIGGGYDAGMIMVGGTEDEVGGKGEMVDPVSMSCQGTDEGA